MSGVTERHSPRRAVLLDGLKSPQEAARLDRLHQPQSRAPELTTYLSPQRPSLIPYVDARLETLDEDRKQYSKSGEPEVDYIRNVTDLTNLTNKNGAKNMVIRHFQICVFKGPTESRRLGGLGMASGGFPMRREHIPDSFDPDIKLRLSQSKPDILYGYN
ncbi:uncharacterized protein PV07_08490 [Cladophialophora immunda]|uniref:Uncharacterized protein n=1 Tax=Cladophialophora immunda TaxID=569365 RepID=A0A0D2AK41_9EURO|nr:uncharacterized protein PV07_08490 [Cladophialophora immunda]KIW25302.1 hypothetical protein PV07_08490 [Cladophialophora immunda]